MEYAETKANAATFAMRAIEEMQQRGITANPNNFAVWYMHATGYMPDLSKAIAHLDDTGETFTEGRCEDLFMRYLSSADEEAAVAEASEKLSQTMTSVIGNIHQAGVDTDAFCASLDEAMTSLQDVDGSSTAKSAIASALETTWEMALKNRSLEAELQATSDEVTRLREDLESLREEAYTDGLTGIANRKKFDFSLRRDVTSATERGAALSLLMLDIDYFKKFNDTYGHIVGDQVLRLLAETLIENVKGQDTAARYGGEEFSVILPNTDLTSAATVAEQIRAAISSKSVRNKTTGEDFGQVTISIGVSTLVLGEPVAHFINRADQALYAAKDAGRNCVCTERDLPASETNMIAAS